VSKNFIAMLSDFDYRPLRFLKPSFFQENTSKITGAGKVVNLMSNNAKEFTSLRDNPSKKP